MTILPILFPFLFPQPESSPPSRKDESEKRRKEDEGTLENKQTSSYQDHDENDILEGSMA